MSTTHNHLVEKIRNTDAAQVSGYSSSLPVLMESVFVALRFLFLATVALGNTWSVDRQLASISPVVEVSRPGSLSNKDMDMLSAGYVVPPAQTRKIDLRKLVPHNLLPHSPEDYTCSNAHINAVSMVNADHVTVDLDSKKFALQPSVCMTSFVPAATFWASLPTFGNPLRFDIVKDGRDNRYNLGLSTNGGSENTIRFGFTFYLQDNKNVDR